MAREVKKKKTPKAKKKTDLTIAKLREVAPGIAGNDKTLKLLKRLGISPAELIKKNSSGINKW